MSENPLLYQIGITLIKGVGPVLARNLIAYLGSAEAVFKESEKNLAKIPEIGPVLSKQIAGQQVLQRAEQEIAFIEKNKIQPFFYTEKNYPYRLKECPDAPVMLYFKGNADLNKGRFLGIVGTRKCTEYGKELCQNLLKEMAKSSPGTVIVSGMAYGVDICAHKAAVDAGLPTLGVLGHGLDRIYPQTHRSTAVRMLDRGGLLTEYLSETNPDRQNFVQRNRIIAGLCDATLVVESGAKGGSLITANIAQSYNRDVFAFPGRVGDEQSSGCNHLIKHNQAALIENAADLLSAMSWEPVSEKATIVQPALFIDLNEEEQQLVEQLRHTDGLQLNEIALRASFPVSRTSALLLEMEFKGVVKCLPGNVYKLRI
ncbi:MAG: DNA-processing protein DprA [Prevotellaceae bacterium]|jgi:DNA processing protein|nr:DNA-processing protein DprA [Prevotellaceae bacterium]